MEMLKKIKEEPLDSSEPGPSLLANAKSAYRNGSCDSDDVFSYNGPKRKSTDITFYTRKRGRYISPTGTYSSPDVDKHLSAEAGPHYECLLCEERFPTEDDRMQHVSLVHKSKSNTNRRHSNRFPRHTCQICFARFRTLKDFFSHTNCHAENPGLSAIQKSINASMINNSLQRFLLNSVSSSTCDVFQTAFKCECCEKIFSSRDAYAMHVMMRVKNDSCKPSNVEQTFNTGKWNPLNGKMTEKGTCEPEKQFKSKTPSPKPEVLPSELNKACYVDVTNATEKDEYLQSVLESSVDKFYNQNITLVLKDPQKCMICHKLFADKDNLAMHVMSYHINDPASPDLALSPNRKTNAATELSRFIQNSQERRKVAATTLFCDYCKLTFTDHDSLAMHILNHTLNAENEKSNKADETSPPLPHRGKEPAGLWPSQEVFKSSNNLESPLNLVTSKMNGGENEAKNTSEVDAVSNKSENGRSDVKDAAANNEKTVFKENKHKTQLNRSVSMPDMRSNVDHVPFRPSSVGGLEERYIYVYNDTIQSDNQEDSAVDPPIDMSTRTCHVVSDDAPFKSCGREQSDRIVLSSNSDEVKDPRELMKYFDKPVYMCRFCEIIFMNRTTFYLHKGLHNVNNPWQCNMCGKICMNVHDFSAHVMHF